MPNEVLTGARYPASSAAPNVNQDIQNAVADLADNTIPNFTTTTTRNTAYTSWVSAGNTMRNGLICTVADKPYLYSGGAWRPLSKGVDGGIIAVTTSAGGDVNLSHTLGVVPSFCTVVAIGTTGAAQYGKPHLNANPTSSLVPIRVTDVRDGTPMANWAITLSWSAALL